MRRQNYTDVAHVVRLNKTKNNHLINQNRITESKYWFLLTSTNLLFQSPIQRSPYRAGFLLKLRITEFSSCDLCPSEDNLKHKFSVSFNSSVLKLPQSASFLEQLELCSCLKAKRQRGMELDFGTQLGRKGWGEKRRLISAPSFFPPFWLRLKPQPTTLTSSTHSMWSWCTVTSCCLVG